MRAVVQRVSRAEVRIDGVIAGSIAEGLLVYLGVGLSDTGKDAEALAAKVAGLRIFEDREGKMNLSVLDRGLSALVVSQFTLYGDARRGHRPSFVEAMPPDRAEPLYETFIACLKEKGVPVASGRFRAMMDVDAVNAGPVTILLDSARQF